MQTLQDLRIEKFLPLSKMREVEESAHASYIAARPFRHIMFDNFFDPELLNGVLTEFSQTEEIQWRKYDNDREIKLACAKEASFGPITRLLLYHLNSMTFLEFLSKITGIQNLISDPGFEGGGLHQIVPGGKLGVHVDFNKHRRYNLDRRLNLLLYLNKEWRDEYGGHLELWDTDVTRSEVKLSPVFNRVVIFGTTDFTYHGHPDPLRCPEGMTRKSLALYYFSNGRPAHEISDEHSTLFKERHRGEFKATWRLRAARIARDCLPPAIARALRKSM